VRRRGKRGGRRSLEQLEEVVYIESENGRQSWWRKAAGDVFGEGGREKEKGEKGKENRRQASCNHMPLHLFFFGDYKRKGEGKRRRGKGGERRSFLLVFYHKEKGKGGADRTRSSLSSLSSTKKGVAPKREGGGKGKKKEGGEKVGPSY